MECKALVKTAEHSDRLTGRLILEARSPSVAQADFEFMDTSNLASGSRVAWTTGAQCRNHTWFLLLQDS